MPHAYIIRGISGSGKSTLAKSLNIFHVESDQYFMREGEYKWNSSYLSIAHERCFNLFRDQLLYGADCVVSNTFTRYWEMERYINFCKQNDIPYTIIRMCTEYQNTHSVPEEHIEKTKKRMEDVDGEITNHEFDLRKLIRLSLKEMGMNN